MMKLDIKICLLVLFASIFVFECVFTAVTTEPPPPPPPPGPVIPPTLRTSEVADYLSNLNTRGRQQFPSLRGNAQVAAIQVLDQNRNEMHYDASPYLRDGDVHAEQYLLDFSNLENHLPPSGYVFLHTYNSPCIQGCVSIIDSFATNHPNLRVYVGYIRAYGTGDRRLTADISQMDFRNSLYDMASNVHFMQFPVRGNPRWVNYDTVVEVNIEMERQLTRTIEYILLLLHLLLRDVGPSRIGKRPYPHDELRRRRSLPLMSSPLAFPGAK